MSIESAIADSPAISTRAMFDIGRDNLDAEVRRDLLDRVISFWPAIGPLLRRTGLSSFLPFLLETFSDLPPSLLE